MSDLDFDELDKAVNTLMSDVPKVEPPKTDNVKTLTIKSTLPNDDARPPLEKLDSALNQTTPVAAVKDTATVTLPSRAAATATTSLAARRGGRFMDVVHPSSDMKTTTPSTPRPASRQGLTIAPSELAMVSTSVEEPSSAEVVVSDNTDTTPVVDVVTTAETGSEAIQHPKKSSGSDWPDPLDMSGYDAQIDGAPAKTTDDDLVVIADDTEPDTMRPLDTPFLADTKVEKRPLGGAVTVVAKDETSSVEEPGHAPVLGSLAGESTDHPEAHNQLPAHPGDVEAQLPPELQSDLMAIETDGGTTTPTPATADAKPAPVGVVAKQVDEKPIEKEAVTATIAAPAMSVKADALAKGPTSITQQYNEEPSSSDQSSGSIYDTDSYHQPLAHPAKHSSGWLWVVWILLLLLVGGSGAMALYFLDII